jgi:dienelactone hydrolase
MKKIKLLFTAVLLICNLFPILANGEIEMDVKKDESKYPMGTVLGDATSGAPENAKRGEFAIGYREIEIVNPSQLDVLTTLSTNVETMYDRPLKLGIWYPADIGEDEIQLCSYTDYYGRVDHNNLEPFEIVGRAVREASPLKGQEPYPLIIISHGYPGSLYIMSYLCENLATKGYVVVAIAHTDSTYEDAANFASTLINRSFDQKFTIQEIEKLSQKDGWLNSLVDTSNIGLIGYSMGGYGSLRTLGVNMSDEISKLVGPYDYLLKSEEKDQLVNNIKASVLFAPWGAEFGNPDNLGIYDKDSLKNITCPTLWVAGTKDDIAGYQGIRGLYNSTSSSDRYLLSYQNVMHNCAPNAAPLEAYSKNWDLTSRWADPSWDTRRLNNINMHFVSAFMDYYLKGDENKLSYFDVKVENASDGVYSVNKDGTFKDDHTYWPGFENRSVEGVILEHLSKNN